MGTRYLDRALSSPAALSGYAEHGNCDFCGLTNTAVKKAFETEFNSDGGRGFALVLRFVVKRISAKVKKRPPRCGEAFFALRYVRPLAAIAGGARFDLIGRDVDRFTGDFNPGECMPLEQFVNAKDFDQTGGKLDEKIYMGIDLSADAD